MGRVCAGNRVFTLDAHETDIGRSVLREIENRRREERGGRIARITINRPEKRNAFTPKTIKEMQRCFEDARDDASVGVVVLRSATWRFVLEESERPKRGWVHGTRERKEEVRKVPRLNVFRFTDANSSIAETSDRICCGYCVGGGHFAHDLRFDHRERTMRCLDRLDRKLDRSMRDTGQRTWQG